MGGGEYSLNDNLSTTHHVNRKHSCIKLRKGHWVLCFSILNMVAGPHACTPYPKLFTLELNCQAVYLDREREKGQCGRKRETHTKMG